MKCYPYLLALLLAVVVGLTVSFGKTIEKTKSVYPMVKLDCKTFASENVAIVDFKIDKLVYHKSCIRQVYSASEKSETYIIKRFTWATKLVHYDTYKLNKLNINRTFVSNYNLTCRSNC